MKTTIDLPDELMRRVKIRAINENKKLKVVVAEFLETALAQRAQPGPSKLPLPMKLKGRGPLSLDEIEAAIGRSYLRTSHQIYKIVSFGIVAPYTLRVCFDDGVTRQIDLEPVLHGEIFGPLRDLPLFEQAKLDAEIHTLVWPNGADFDPTTLHDWPTNPAEVTAAASPWREAHKAIS